MLSMKTCFPARPPIRFRICKYKELSQRSNLGLLGKGQQKDSKSKTNSCKERVVSPMIRQISVGVDLLATGPSIVKFWYLQAT